jgi:hypothetical protein
MLIICMSCTKRPSQKVLHEQYLTLSIFNSIKLNKMATSHQFQETLAMTMMALGR